MKGEVISERPGDTCDLILSSNVTLQELAISLTGLTGSHWRPEPACLPLPLLATTSMFFWGKNTFGTFLLSTTLVLSVMQEFCDSGGENCIADVDQFRC